MYPLFFKRQKTTEHYSPMLQCLENLIEAFQILIRATLQFMKQFQPISSVYENCKITNCCIDQFDMVLCTLNYKSTKVDTIIFNSTRWKTREMLNKEQMSIDRFGKEIHKASLSLFNGVCTRKRFCSHGYNNGKKIKL